jgi:hypothetical protein
MRRFHLEIELDDDDDARRVQLILMANDMTMKQFTEYAVVKVAEAHVGVDPLLTYCSLVILYIVSTKLSNSLSGDTIITCAKTISRLI